MSNTLGQAIRFTVFGESHGPCVGGVIDGLPGGLAVDMEYIMKEMAKRKSVASISTPRREDDVPEFLSGVRDGHTEGTPLTFIIRNKVHDSSAYEQLAHIARPGHADYTAQMKYHGFQDASGGGHFSGRVTAAIVAGGAIIRQALEAKGIIIGSHIAELGGIRDAEFDLEYPAEDIAALNARSFAVLDEERGAAMMERISELRATGDSAGGILETAVLGLEPGIGEPLFGSIESELSAAVFAVGGVKGIEFGAGFGFAGMTGSQANDSFYIRDGRVVTGTNNNGGINGGISNGMPVVFRTVIKPTPSISLRQDTVDFGKMEETEISVGGRHDPAIIHRARVVIESLTAIVLADLLCRRYGYEFLR